MVLGRVATQPFGFRLRCYRFAKPSSNRQLKACIAGEPITDNRKT